MDGIYQHFTVRTFFSFLILILLQTSTETQNICSVPDQFEIAENNPVDASVGYVSVDRGVSLNFTNPADLNNPFGLEGNQLIAVKVLDHEENSEHIFDITCHSPDGLKKTITVVVFVENKNDNSPKFDMNPYHYDILESQPSGSPISEFNAADADGDTIYYRLTSEPNVFRLLSPTVPQPVLNSSLEYDKIKNITLILFAQDTPLDSALNPSHTATTTILVTVQDVDNRPPWFQPCTEYEVDGILICQSSGYNGTVFLNETGLILSEPVHAIDGDSGINDEIIYSFLGGNGGGVFEIDPNRGNISMQKPADTLGTITLTVLAAQKNNRYQYATTTVTITVQMKSDHPPKFQKSRYQGVVTAMFTMAMDAENEGTPLQIHATDGDYAATGGINPDITYKIDDSGFLLFNGYLFMTTPRPDGLLSLRVVATDTNGESDKAELMVEVKSGPTTTRVPPSTTGSAPPTGESTTNSQTTKDIVTTINPGTSTGSSASTTSPKTTTDPSTPPEGGVSTTKPSPTGEGSITTPHSSTPTGGSGSTTKPSPTGESIITTTHSSKPTGGSGSTTKPSPTGESIITTTHSSKPTGGSGSTTKPSPTSESIITTTHSSTPAGGSGSTTKPHPTGEGSITTASTARPHTGLTTTSASTNKPIPTPEGGVTTGKPKPTGEGGVTTNKPKPTGEGGVTTNKPKPTGEGGITTNKPKPTGEGGVTTNKPKPTGEGGSTTSGPSNPCTVSGGYGPEDMAALGATLGVLLFICLVIIVVLIFRIRKGNADWRKIYETNLFRSSLGQGSGGTKEGIQYTNNAFEKDENAASTGSDGQEGKSKMAAMEPQKAPEDNLISEAIVHSQVSLHALLGDDISQASSEKSDSDKDVKPILTKERRADEGYKSVWFKEDIDPNAKEEVVIIPDSRENESEEEDEDLPSSSRDDNPLIKAPKVAFNDSDLDSGLGVKMGDQGEDSDDDNVLNISL